MPGVGVVLGQAKPEQSHQNEQLHVFPGMSTVEWLLAATGLVFILVFTLQDQWDTGAYQQMKQVHLSHACLVFQL